MLKEELLLTLIILVWKNDIKYVYNTC